MALNIKRVYDPPDPSDGVRILIDRLWPRGLSKDRAKIDEWFRDIAPSDRLRQWFGHKPERWEEFRKRYREELRKPERRALLQQIAALAQKGTVTVVFAAKDAEHCNARVIAEVLRRS